MGKQKIGKQRRDKYYALAKEAIFSSFRCFVGLSESSCVQAYTTESELYAVGGVDLVPIRPLPNAITIQGDITTDACKVAVKKQLQTWNADCVLHDGSPNVGKSWHHDAFQQAQLTLQALKLAVDILRPGGWFVTKLFRSKDHPALVEVFRKLFTKVHVTKPQASRQESAEAFVVCQGFQPKSVKTVSLQYKKVFEDLSLEPEKTKINTLYPEKQKRKAEGYADGAVTLFNKVDALEFVTSDDYLEILGSANELILDDPNLLAHPATDDEVKTLCKDVKVLGRKEIRQLMKWRRQMKQHLKSLQEKPEHADEVKRRKSMKEKRRYKRKLEYEMVVPGDEPITAEEQNLFSIHRVVTQVVYSDARTKEVKHLSAEELALGQLWIHSSKTRRDIVDAGFNRYAHNDENLPDWFVADEKKHYRANLPVTKEAVELYKRRQMEINARPIKKVVEAKMRKKRRVKKITL
ncbi:rrna methyltransferase 3 [Trichuris trichiura]|uniref:Rrna methyltransferase 3 n=1 Tax=Trichuris trichiura TaxID=36087 RepID=A0A077Z8V5_TRITR|nr:rrna methyltransferase 3 [Trichuris trichiura]